MSEIAEFKQDNRAMWAAGDYQSIADLVWEVGDRIVRHVGVRPGDDVLDVACGTGNAAIRAAAAGGRVVGVDLTPELFESGRAMAARAGVEVEWVEGDAEALPFEDESFDVVLSTFGCMFAPRHDVTARELARVLRPGGRLGLCNWTPEGAVGDFFRTIGAHLPPPPPFATPPPLWGTERHVSEVFAGTGVELEWDRERVSFRFESAEAAVSKYETTFGPIVRAREFLEPQGRWPEARSDMAALFERVNSSGGSNIEMAAEYLVVLGRKAGSRGG